MSTLIQLVGGLALLVVSLLWSGYVLSVLWAWFAVPIFALSALTVAQAIALRLVVKLLTVDVKIVREKQTWPEDVFTVMAVPLLFLCLGWGVKQFI